MTSLLGLLVNQLASLLLGLRLQLSYPDRPPSSRGGSCLSHSLPCHRRGRLLRTPAHARCPPSPPLQVTNPLRTRQTGAMQASN